MCFGTPKSKSNPDARKNAEIEKQIKQDQKKAAREVKVLLLGKTCYIANVCAESCTH